MTADIHDHGDTKMTAIPMPMATPARAVAGAAATTSPLLEGHNLRKTYRLGRHNTVEALRGVDVRIEPGAMVAIMGPSGSGKSTLMHILGLLHAPDVTGGAPGASDELRPQLRFGGRDIVALSDGERTKIRAKDMGFVFQEFNLVPTLTALENVLIACEYAGRGGAGARTAALEALEMVGLAGRAGHRPAELSGGEQQRVAIARALVNRPALVLADEPTGNLDSARTYEVLELLRRLNRERGQTFVLVTHDQEVGDACDRVIRMRDGIVRDGAR
jgi:putative ABC transport system ATP-binding protein